MSQFKSWANPRRQTPREDKHVTRKKQQGHSGVFSAAAHHVTQRQVGETFQESRQVTAAFWNTAGSLPTACPHPGNWKKLLDHG